MYFFKVSMLIMPIYSDSITQSENILSYFFYVEVEGCT